MSERSRPMVRHIFNKSINLEHFLLFACSSIECAMSTCGTGVVDLLQSFCRNRKCVCGANGQFNGTLAMGTVIDTLANCVQAFAYFNGQSLTLIRSKWNTFGTARHARKRVNCSIMPWPCCGGRVELASLLAGRHILLQNIWLYFPRASPWMNLDNRIIRAINSIHCASIALSVVCMQTLAGHILDGSNIYRDVCSEIWIPSSIRIRNRTNPIAISGSIMLHWLIGMARSLQWSNQSWSDANKDTRYRRILVNQVALHYPHWCN